MKGLGLFLLLSHCITSSTATTISTVLKTSGNITATFPVHDKETTILATKSAPGPNFNFTLSAKGKNLKSDSCVNCYQGSVWVPLFMITNVIGKSKYLNPFPIPEDVQPPNEIDLSVENRAEMEWQFFTLPIEKDDSTRMYIKNYVIFDLPEDEEVWLAYRSKDRRATSFSFQLNAGNRPSPVESDINANGDWSFVRIYEDKIDFGNTNSKIEEPVRKGRSLRLGLPPDSPLQYQVFAVPLRPKDIVTPIAISVVIVLLLLLAASYFCYRCFLKKKNKAQPEGNATITREWTSTTGFSRTVAHPSVNRQDSAPVSENSLYSVPTDAHPGFTRQTSSRDSENSLYAVPTFTQPGPARQTSSHDSENSLYAVPAVSQPGLVR